MLDANMNVRFLLKKSFSAGAAIVLLAGSGVAQAPTSFTPEFAMMFRNISSVTPSPDGTLAVWVESRNVMEPERSEVVSQIWTGRTDGSKRMQLTRGEGSSTSPGFSPDGRFVYFLSSRTAKQQIYRIAVSGGEAEALTAFKGQLGAYELSQDGRQLAFWGLESSPDDDKKMKEKRDWKVVDSNTSNHSLYVISAEADADGKRKPRKLTDGKFHVAGATWSPDGKAIAFEHAPSPGANDVLTKGDISEVNLESGAIKPVASTPAIRTGAIYSPDGKYLAYQKAPAPFKWAGERRFVLMSRATGDQRELPTSFDEQPNVIGWLSDSSGLLFSEGKRTKTALYKLPVDGPPQVIFEPRRGVVSGARMNAKGTWVGLSHETTDTPVEAYVMKVGTTALVQVSRANSDLPKLPVGKTEAITWKSKDGLEVEGLLTYPVNYEPGKKYPLILNIHGGPTGVFNENFVGRGTIYPIATFAARGYAVLRPNPRGSSAYGKTFRFANYNDWGGKDFEDDQTGVDHVIAMGVADPDRLAVMGWSYGGFMTSWTITQTNRFKAAVIGAGVTNLWSFTGTADVTSFIPDYFGGEPYEAFENYRKHSPITHINNVTTPTLVLHGEADVRVPLGQGIEYYNALKTRGVTAKMVTYPRQPHGPREPKFVLDIMQRHLDWVDKYVR